MTATGLLKPTSSDDVWLVASGSLLVVVLAFNDQWWPTQAIASMLALLGLLVPSTRNQSSLWFSMSAVLAAGFVLEWWTTDNHHLLIIATLLLFGICARSRDKVDRLSSGAAALVAVAFAAALIAKAMSPDFRSGVFASYVPTLDPRLGDLAVRVGATSRETLVTNQSALDSLATTETVGLTPVSDWFAIVMLVWTVGLELLVAVGFAVRHRRLRQVGNIALLTFIVTTYSVVPVVGFAGVLSVLGFAQAESRLLKALYVAAFVSIPLQDAIARVL